MGGKTISYQTLRESVATRLVRACEKLRAHGLVAKELTVFISTSRHDRNPTYKGVLSHCFIVPTAETQTCLDAALALVERLFKPGYAYKKSGVIFSQLYNADQVPKDLFHQPVPKKDPLWRAVDALNQTYGRHSVIVGATGLHKPWQPIMAQCSPRYTTRIDEILVI